MVSLSNKQFALIKEKLYKYCGIYLNDSRLTMVQNKIHYFMQKVQIYNIDILLSSIDGNPKIKQQFINIFTINKTDFFRESLQFQDLVDKTLPILFQKNKPIKIYCCGSSTGQEPYSIAISVLHAKKLYDTDIPVSIMATDIDTDVLHEAKEGIYKLNFKIEKLPSWCNIHTYFDILDNSQDLSIPLLKIKDEIKSMITFKQLNLFNKHYPFTNQEFDILFCRNVLIYFKQEDQEEILSRLINTLRIDGTFYLGHSEDLFKHTTKFKKLGNKTFIKIKT